MDFIVEYDKRKKYIDSLVSCYAGEFSSPSKALCDSLNYSISTGGKRLRAILSLELFEHFGGKVDKSIEIFLAAIELLHLYTLLHDDLPCMDNDDYRRGKLTNHKVFGEAMALLCGDSLLNFAYELLFSGCRFSSDKERYIDGCLAFSSLCGGKGIIGGQALEFEKNRIIDTQKTMRIYKHKTCDLILAGLVFVSILADANKKQIEDVKEFAYHFGMAFQIRDDFLDKKEKGSVEKYSLVGLIGEENANIKLEENKKAALTALDKLGIKCGFILKLTEFAAKRSI